MTGGAAVGTRSRMAAWNFASTLVFAAVTMLTGLFVTPLLVRWLDDDRFGAVRMVAETVGYLTLLDLGLGGALGPLLARALAAPEPRSWRATFAAGMRLYLVVTAIILTVGLAITPWITAWITRKITADPAFTADVRWAWILAVAGFATLILLPFRALLDAEQRGFVVNLVFIGQSLTVSGLMLLFAWLGLGVRGQSLASLVGMTAGILALTALAIRRRPGAFAALGDPPDPEAAAALRRLSGPTLLMNLAGRLSLLTDGLVVGMILGPAAVTILYLTQRLIAIVQSQLQGIGTAAWAGLADLHARGERAVFHRRLVELTRMVAVLGVAALGPIVAFNDRFLALWVGSAKDGGQVVALAATANAMTQALLSLWGWCLSGTGHAPRLVRMSLVSTAINLAASVGLTYRLGVAGPLLGTTVAFLAVNLWWVPLLLRDVFGVPRRELARAVVVPLIWGIPATLALWLAARAAPPPGWIGLALAMGSSAALYLAFAARFLLAPEDRAVWRRRLIAALPRPLARSLGM